MSNKICLENTKFYFSRLTFVGLSTNEDFKNHGFHDESSYL